MNIFASLHNFKKICFLLVLVILVTQPVSAQLEKLLGSVVIDQAVDVEFVPEEAYFIVSFDDESSMKVRGILIPPFNVDEKSAKVGKWIVGGQIPVATKISEFKYILVLKGKAGEFSYFPEQVWNIKADDIFSGSVEKIKSHLQQRQDLLKSWQMQVNAQDASLKRLRADADLIANVSRIVEVLEETEAKRYEIENLDKDIAYLKDLFRQARNQSTPKNFNRRELELTKQVAELAQVAKNAETSEFGRKSQSQNDLQRNLSVIEATRLDDEERLKAELQAVRERRIRLEKSGATERPVDSKAYWDSQ